MRKPKELISQISAIFILLSAFGYLFIPSIAPWIMIIAVIVFSYTIITTPYPGKSIRGKRLFNFQVIACVLFIVATYLMFRNKNEWVLLLISGAVFLFYAAVFMPKEYEKENDKKDI